MKTFNCYRCDCYLGEMSQGKFHKDAVVLCKTCKKLIDDILNLSSASNNNKMKDCEVVDNIMNLFNMKK